MTPVAKGTVEGKNAEIKNNKSSRFDLPGRFSKKIERRQSNGKKAAALDIFQFEKILVEIIMDLNGSPINPRRIPPDALQEGAKVASRSGFHNWALTHRSGFTRNMGKNFVYEYLMTSGVGKITPLGIKFQGEIYKCDRLRELGLLSASVQESIKTNVAYNPLLASEIYFYDSSDLTWVPAYNIDPEVYDIKVSFPEVKDFRTLQNQLVNQAELNNYSRRRVRVKSIRNIVKKSVDDKRNTLHQPDPPDLRQNRSQERANERTEGLNGAIANRGELLSTVTPSTIDHSHEHDSNHSDIEKKSLWDEVDAINIIE
ncbi:hypothetical protein CUN61_08545 [Pseudomonas arsenicoxydans]|uniref:Uncharacterized protein n=2 Tax=Pseudomonas arsenicoxydans TaxID=702115 RepID=A0A4P6G3V7_9PSED|nr:hypothetical protein CUN61_08545 [Pseudomonas arsenicoxydans]